MLPIPVFRNVTIISSLTLLLFLCDKHHHVRIIGLANAFVLRHHTDSTYARLSFVTRYKLITRITNVLLLDGTDDGNELQTTAVSAEEPGQTKTNEGKRWKQPYKHADIMWKLCPIPEIPDAEVEKWRFQANIARKNTQFENLIMCPPGGQAIIEAYEKSTNQLIGRFGITTHPGPAIPPIVETIMDIYKDIDLDSAINANIAAVKFMFVNETYRGRDVGHLALDIIHYIHACQKCDYTILVADDKSSSSGDDGYRTRKLVTWYEKCGNYTVAPSLQDALGSPNGIYGITMIAPITTHHQQLPANCTLIWWE